MMTDAIGPQLANALCRPDKQCQSALVRKGSVKHPRCYLDIVSSTAGVQILDIDGSEVFLGSIPHFGNLDLFPINDGIGLGLRQLNGSLHRRACERDVVLAFFP